LRLDKGGYAYILSSKGRRLYAGVTSQLQPRIAQHKAKTSPNCFTARYNIDRLVYYEAFESMGEAIARESAIKNMHRLQKIQLVVSLNPTWRDLSEAWGEPCPTFDESKLKPPNAF
jgi:putative endonuclease